MSATGETQPLLSPKSGRKRSLQRASTVLDRAKELGVDLGKPLGEGYVREMTEYDRFFRKHKNQVFGDHLEVASRGACFIVICAFPFVAPHEICPLCEALVESEIYTAASITYFIYTLYVYLGDILHFAQGGIMGSFLAVFSIWNMQGFMPGGYTTDKPHRWYMGSLWGICFVFLILWLNFDDNTRIFSLSTFVWYWMAFLKPDATAGFAQNWNIDFTGKAIRELLVAIAGCSIAIIAGYFPYPIYAHKKALAISRSMMDQIYMSKRDFVEYYCGDEDEGGDGLKADILAREAQTLRNEAGQIKSLLDSSWYECMGTGKWQKQRVMIEHLRRYVDQTIDLISNAFNTCLSENFDVKHKSIMNSVRSNLLDVVEQNGKILQTSLAIIEVGHADESVVDVGEYHVNEARKYVQRMTETLQHVRKEQGLAMIDDEIAGENVVCLTFSKLTADTAKLFFDLQGEQEEKSSWRTGGGILGIFEPSLLFDPDHLMWTLRNALSIILSFYAGWMGYGQYIKQYNAALASTVAVLLSKFVGSAMTKNLARLQGVVIGIVLGNLLYAFLAWCTWWGHLLVGFALYFWALMGLFLYFHSENYSTVGLLLSVFGTSALLRPCSNEETESSGHSQIVDVTVAIVIMSVIDMLLSRARASDMAIDALRNAQVEVGQYMERLFKPEELSMKARHGELKDLIAGAKGICGEAAMEPRYWRRNWATDVSDQAIECLATTRFCLNAIESAVLDDPDAEGNCKKTDAFMKAIQMDTFKHEKDGVLALLMQHYNLVMKTLEDDLGDDPAKTSTHDVFIERMEKLNKYEARKTAEIWPQKIEAWQNALNKEINTPRWQGKVDTSTLRHDPLATMSLFVECVKAMFLELDEVLEAIVD